METKILLTDEICEEFHEIIKDKLIRPVYQPIVSLQTGDIFAYEALSRIKKDKCCMNIGELFHAAELMDEVWELENLCRKQSLKCAINKPIGVKLFLNVDPNSIRDEKFMSGTTTKYLKQYGLNPSDIIFEITERSTISDSITFQETLQHYRKQKFEVAIDDFGEGYSGINRVCAVRPEYIKLDIELVKNIDKDSIKQAVVENVVTLCRGIGINVIAEGVETRDELRELIHLQVAYGQGYYLQKPQEIMGKLDSEKKQEIRKLCQKTQNYYEPTFFGNVETICKAKETTTTETRVSFLYDYIQRNPNIIEITVLDEERHAVGIITRGSIMDKLGGRFGYDLNSKKKAKDIMCKDFMGVDSKTQIEIVSKMALAREQEHLYEAVVVTRDDKYLGVVTVKDLLEVAISIQVKRAADSSPLTGLPGNKTIEKKIKKCLSGTLPYTVVYLDLDNFKAYNDAYGFNNGDMMIQTVVSCMEECCIKDEFMGHIGGDDFVIITGYYEAGDLCKNILDCFSKSIEHLYNPIDWERGYIISKNRNGFQERFPIATLSIAGLSNQTQLITEVEEFSKKIAKLKKKSKQVEGNCYLIE